MGAKFNAMLPNNKEKGLFDEHSRIKSQIEKQVDLARIINRVIVDAINIHKERGLLTTFSNEECLETKNANIELISNDSKFINNFIKKYDNVRLYNNISNNYYLIGGTKSSGIYTDHLTAFTTRISKDSERYDKENDFIYVDKNLIRVVSVKDRKNSIVIDSKEYNWPFNHRVVDFDRNTNDINIYDSIASTSGFLTGPYKLTYSKDKSNIEKRISVLEARDDEWSYKGRKFDLYGGLLRRVVKEYINKPIIRELE